MTNGPKGFMEGFYVDHKKRFCVYLGSSLLWVLGTGLLFPFEGQLCLFGIHVTRIVMGPVSSLFEGLVSSTHGQTMSIELVK